MRKIIIAGGTGFLGRVLENYFNKKGDSVFILSRSPKAYNHLKWDAKIKGTWANHLNKADVLINLTGKSVDCRYTKANKAAILNSRIESTKVLNEVVAELAHPPKVWVNVLRKKCNRPLGLPQPKWMLEIGTFFLRTETELLLKSRYVYPEKLLNHGFQFQYPKLELALNNLVK